MKFDAPDLTILHIDEPNLAFGHEQTTDHPKDGLFLYGPHNADKERRIVSVGVVGTKAGLKHFREWIARAMDEIPVPPPSE